MSAACVFSGTAVTGALTAPVALAAETQAASAAPAAASDSPVFSWDNATVYFLLTDRFCNGNPNNDHSYGRGQNQSGQNVSYDNYAAFQGGDFAGITQKLNEGYFTELGVNAIWLSAPYEQIHGYCVGCDGESFAHYSYHGYYVLDYTESDKNFGTKEEFRTMVDTAHSKGIRIVMDIVMNHAGYQTLLDMNEYSFGPLKSGWDTYYYAHQNINNSSYHGFIGYDDSSAGDWAKWWGSSWVRCGLPGYTKGSGDIEGSLADLPDFKTGDTSNVSLPEILKTKWTKEGTYATKSAKYGSNTVTGYISTWLAEWVREFGVDGFRCDTAKHVEKSAWGILKQKCVTALREWKAANPTKKLDDLDFWMTGEHFGHGVGKDDYYTTGGFDSMINFEFAPKVNSSNIPAAASVESVYSRYASTINGDPTFNVLSYISSHDTVLAQGDRKYAGSFMLMLPGAVQIYYGDETNRPLIQSEFANKDPGAGHQFRSFMNWDNMDTGVLQHWQKVGQFRNNHLSVGAGQHKVISAYSSSDGYTFSRTYSKDGVEDKIVATLFAEANKTLTIDVSSVFANGTEITNFYDGTTCKVSGGKVTFNTGANGTILMQEPNGPKGHVNVIHINKDTGETIKTETLTGPIGESYATQPLDTEGYTVASVTGNTTGTFSETDVTVTYYYTFDSNNYGIVVTKHVDANGGAELAESVSQVGRIGTSYTTSPVSIKNYEVDATLPANANGTFAKGTITVTYKYNYVEPTNLIVHYYNANNWSSVYLYAYDESGAAVQEFTGKWPGAAMEPEGDGWFVKSVDSTESATIIFNNNAGSQEPAGVNTPGYNATGEVYVKGGKVMKGGKVTVRYVTTDGKVLASVVLHGLADGTTTYTTEAKTFDGYTLKTTPTNATGKFTEDPIIVTYIYESTSSPLVNSSTMSATTITKGSSVTLKGIASGGTTPYQFAYYYKKSSSSSWTTLADYSTTATKTFTPSYTGEYDVKVTVKDAASKTADKTFTLTVNAPTSDLVNNSSLSVTTVPKKTAMTIKGAASKGTSPYQFAYYYKFSTKTEYTTIAGFSSATSKSFTPEYTGTYNIKVIAKDSTGATAEKVMNLTVTAEQELKNTSTVAATSVEKGSAIKVYGKATGGSTPYKFAYYYKLSTKDEYTTLASYSTATSKSFTPNYSGTYNVKVVVKDNSGKTASKVINVTVTLPLSNKSTVSASSVPMGTKVTIKGAASGGKTPYKYAYYYKKSTSSSWTTIKDFSTSTYATFTPGAVATYNVKVIVKDASSKTVTKTMEVKSTKAALANKSTVSATSVTMGTKVTIKGAASGGTSPYKYAYYYKKSTSSGWTTIKDFSTTTSVTFTPGAVATYNVKVIVKDSKNATAEFTTNVKSTKAPLTNNSTVSSTKVSKGSTITVTGKASGGTSPYSYAFYYKKSTSSNWTVSGEEFGSATTAKIKLSYAATYQVMVKVMDKSGSSVSKTFTITST